MTLLIIVTRNFGRPFEMLYQAYDDATYDGAEDSKNRNQLGYGPTPRDAALDLLINVLELPSYTPFAMKVTV